MCKQNQTFSPSGSSFRSGNDGRFMRELHIALQDCNGLGLYPVPACPPHVSRHWLVTWPLLTTDGKACLNHRNILLGSRVALSRVSCHVFWVFPVSPGGGLLAGYLGGIRGVWYV